METNTKGIKLLLLVLLIVPFITEAGSDSRTSVRITAGYERPGNENAVIKKIIKEIPVSGKVTNDTDGDPLPGVSVLIKGTTKGTVTDVDGNYTINADENATLIFSYIGYNSQEVAIGGKTKIDVGLVLNIESLQEVVVVGYGTVKKSDVTGSLSSVSAKQIEQVPVQSISQALQGRAAGVDVSMNSFRPGDAPQIRIRGNRSLKATNNPLIVLDGIPLAEGSSINDFDPADIESVEILKDASATAIYGSRGANGVILVTLKKGKKGKGQITYDGYIGWSSPLVEIDMFSPSDFAELRREAYRNSNNKQYNRPYADPNLDYTLFNQDLNMWESVAAGYEWEDKEKRIPKYRPVTEEEKEIYRQYYAIDGTFNPDTMTRVPVYNPNNVRGVNWNDYALRTGIKQRHHISFSGGTDKLRVYFSGGYYDEKGIQETQGFKRYNVRLGLEYELTDWLKIGTATNGSFSTQEYGSNLYFDAIGQLPIAPPYGPDGKIVYRPGNDALIYNPLANLEANNFVDERRTNRIMGSYYAEVKILKGLRYRVNFGPDLRNYRRGQFYGKTSTVRQGGTTQANLDREERFNYVVENLLYYDKDFGDKHSLGVTLLNSFQRDRFESLTMRVTDLPYTSQLFYNLGSTNTTGPEAFGSDYNKKSLVSYMARLNYTLMDRYILTVTGRYDGSSVLAEGNKWQLFPSAAIAWKVKQESFLRDINFIDELKLRGGYGETGNSAVDPYTVQGLLTKTRGVFGSTPAWGFKPNLLANPDLKWETTRQVNAGIDFAFLRGRISGTVDVYQSKTRDLIMDRQLPTVSGFTNIQQNIGSTMNQGVEVSLSTININTARGLKWTTDFVFTKNHEEITELYGGNRKGIDDDVSNRWFIGEPITTYYDFQPIGVWQANEVDAAAVYKMKPGKPKFLDVNGDGAINSQDLVKRGNNVADWSGSMQNTVSYAGVEFSFFLYTRQGQTLASGYGRPTLTGRYTEAIRNYWTPANPSNEFSRPSRDQERPENANSYLYSDGSFVKLRNVSLSYSLPANILSYIRLQNLKVYITYGLNSSMVTQNIQPTL
jgi:TonB-linked SusC/RagA family outer membrane protein